MAETINTNTIDLLNKLSNTSEKEAERKKQETEAAEKQEETSYQNYSESVGNVGQSIQNRINSLKSVREQAKAENAEEKVAKSGEVVSPGEAMELIKSQKAAEKEARKASREAVVSTVKDLGHVVAGGARVLFGTAADSVSGFTDNLTSPGGLVATGAGLAAGTMFGNTGLADVVQNGLESRAELSESNPTEPGVEEKYVEGLETDEDMRAYLYENGNGVPSDPYGEEMTAEPAEEKQFSSAADVRKPMERDALEVGEEDLNALSDTEHLDEALREDFGDDEKVEGEEVTDSWFDMIANRMDAEISGTPQSQQDSQSLAASMAEGVVETVTGSEGAGKAASKAMQKLQQMTEETDRSEAAKQAEQDYGPAYGPRR